MDKDWAQWPGFVLSLNYLSIQYINNYESRTKVDHGK